MADMALSLTKKAVEGTVSRVLAAIDEDTKLKAAAQQDLRFIVGEFQMMQSFLKVAKNNKERTSNEVVQTWVRQLRELAFDVEDCVEFVIHLDTTSRRWPWVWRVLPLPSSMTPAWVGDLDQAVADLKLLKARVEEVSQRNTRYNLLGGDDSGSSSTAPPQVAPEQLDAAAEFPSTVDILRDLWKANAKQSSSLECNLKHLVADGRCNELKVISVWRAAEVDLETAYILDAAYLDPQICKEFKARARVKLMHPFNIQEFLKSLLNQLYVTSHQQDTLGEDLLRTKADSVIQDKLRQLLSKHKYLVILEDLSSAVDWDLIRLCLPDRHNGSRIVISTQQLGIALSCTGEPYRVLQLALFPNDRYIYAFYKPSGIDITELVKQLGQRRVISLWGDEGRDTASLVRDVGEAIVNKTAKFTGVNFEAIAWINDVADIDPEIEYYRKGARYLLVIDENLHSKEHWDLVKDEWDFIKDGLLPVYTKSCIVIIANEEALAKHCEDDSWRKMDEEEQKEANHAAIIGPLFAQEEKYYSWDHDRFGSHGCSRRIDESLFKFGPLITEDQKKRVIWNIIFICIENSCVNAVWGASGVGKSALVRLCYYTVMACSLKLIEVSKLPFLTSHEDYCKELRDDDSRFERFGWVDVPEAFDLAEFSRRLLLDFNSYDPGAMEKTAVDIIHGHNTIIQRCYETIRDRKCLVVIDGLRSTRDWDSMKQAFWCHHHPESCILVITVDESIAKHCVAKEVHPSTFCVRAMDDKSAFVLFEKVVDHQNAERDEKEKFFHSRSTILKQDHGEHIMPKCGGLPKIIDAVAKSDLSFWDNINDDFVTKLKNGPQFGHLKGVFSWMHSYIDGRSDSVKPCIFYLSVFPTNYRIKKAHLLRRWIAEGYCRGTNGCSAKENAESLFNELIDHDIIQYIGSKQMWHVNGFFREYIISQPMEDNLVLALEGQCKPNSQRIVQHLTIMEDWEGEKHVFVSIDVSRLRSLTVYGKWKPFFISDKMKRIRVLDLEGTYGVEDCCLEHIFEILLSLKFICLRGCKSITCLPKALSGLRQLESLDVSGTSIVTLPRAIIKLQKIQYIRAGCKYLPDEDSDDAVRSQQPSETTDKQVDGARQKKLVGCCWTSTKSSQDNDDAVRSQQPSGTTRTPEAEGSDDNVVATSSPVPLISQDKQVDGARRNKLVGCCWTSTKSSQGSDDAVRSQLPSAATPTPEAEGSDGGHQGQHQHHKRKKVGRRCRSRLSPLLPCSGLDDNNNNINSGVEVPKGIEDMPSLHTLGIVNINSARGMDFLTNLKTTLPQLLKLRVCGINKKNWKDLCDALSAHDHLESLSLGLDKDFTEDIYSGNLPKALKSFKVYGHFHRVPATWIRGYPQLANLQKFYIEAIISNQQSLDQFMESSLGVGGFDMRRFRLCIKPTRQVRRLEFKGVVRYTTSTLEPGFLKIDCSSPLEVAFQESSIAGFVTVLIVHCSEGSDFRISSDENGLRHLKYLNTVVLEGYDDTAKYVADLEKQIAAHRQKPVFKFEKLESA